MSQQQGREFGQSQGGSAADTALAGNAISFFQKGIRYLIPSEKKRVSGRILPARDASMSPEDSAYATSVVPYRDRTSGLRDQDTQTEALAGWYSAIKGYKYFGRLMANLTSPLSLKALGGDISIAEIADPIQDCRALARNNPDWKHLTEKPTGPGVDQRAKAVIPRESNFALLNMYAQEERGPWETQLVVVAHQAVEDLKKKLALQTARNQAEVADPNWPDYLYGDVTDPQNGFLVNILPFKVGAITVNGFVFGTKENTIEGCRKQPVTPEILADRRVLFSPKTLRIDTYQDIVNFLVADGTIPYEIIVAACSNMANVPPPPKQNVTYSGPQQPQRPAQPAGRMEGMPVGSTGAPTPPRPPQASQPPRPPTPPKAAETTFWYVDGSGAACEGPRSVVQNIVDGGVDPDIMTADQSSGWVKASSLGFKPTPKPPTPPTPPQAPKPPTPPAPPKPPTPPQAPKPPTPPTPPTPPATLAKYWVDNNGAMDERDSRQVQALVDANTQGLLIMPLDQSKDWGTPESYGFAPDAIPDLPSAQQQAPTGGGLTAEELAELEVYKEKAVNPGADGLSTDDITRMVALTNRLNQQ